jgi:hypothetical protein
MASEIHGPDLFREETVGPAFDEEIIVFLGQDLPADAVVLFQQQYIHGLTVSLGPGFEVYGCCQTGNTPAYDDDIRHVYPFLLLSGLVRNFGDVSAAFCLSLFEVIPEDLIGNMVFKLAR